MGKVFLYLTFTLVFITGSPANAEPFSTPIPWGLSFRDFSHYEPGLIRTTSGLNRFQRTRIARFKKDKTVLGGRVRIYFSFKSNRLYEIEYDFKKPDRKLFESASKALTKQFGKVTSRKTGNRENGDLFSNRTHSNATWENERSNVNMRFIENTFKKGRKSKSLFITFRAKEKKGLDVPHQLMSDSQIRQSGDNEITVAFTGSFAFGDTILKAASESDGEPWDYPFRKIATHLKKADVAVGSLAGVLEVKQIGEVFESDMWAKGISRAGFDLVTTIHPGVTMFGAESLSRSLATLEAVGVRHIGAGKNEFEARKAVSAKINNIRIGFLAYSYVEGFDPRTMTIFTSGSSPGVAGVLDDLKAAKTLVAGDVAQLKTTSDIVVVLFFWGKPGEKCISDNQRQLAEFTLERGANLIVGHHPNSIQPIHESKNGVVLYSLGPLMPTIGKSSPKEDKEGSKRESLIFLATFTKMGLLGYDFIPVRVSKTGETPYQANALSRSEARRMLDVFSGMNKRCRKAKDKGK